MATASASVDIANLAIAKIGEEFITDLTDNTKSARLCNRLYDHYRVELLTKYHWNFALTRTTLAADVDAPAFEYTYRCPVPPDSLRIVEVYNADLESIEWVQEGGYVLTDESAPLNCQYIKNEEDVTKFATTFVEALACRLAYEIAIPIASSTALAEKAKKDADEAIAMAMAMNAIVGNPYVSASNAVCATALALVSAKPLIDVLSDIQLRRACQQIYDDRRKELLFHPWNFAIRRANLKYTSFNINEKGRTWWAASASGTNEYYLLQSSGRVPYEEPSGMEVDGESISAGTAGSLAVDTWDWADNDSLGYSTVYIRLEDTPQTAPTSYSPDSWETGHVAYTVEDVIAPTNQFTYVFTERQLPSDFLRVVASRNYGFTTPIVVSYENGRLYADHTEVSIEYIANVTDTTEFDVYFKKALVYLIASDLAPRFQTEENKLVNWEKRKRLVMNEAFLHNAVARGYEEAQDDRPLSETENYGYHIRYTDRLYRR